MLQEDNIFVLRFYDNEVTPESFSMKELGQLLISLEEGIKSIIESKYPEVEESDICLSLVDVENQSESLYIKSSKSPVGKEAFLYWGHSIQEETYTNLPEKAYNAYKFVYSLTKKKNCKTEFLHENKQVYSISAETLIVKQETVFVKTDSTLYGTINKIGGDKSKAWLDLNDGNRIDFEITKEQAAQLRERLYEPVALKGSVKWNIRTKDVLGFKLYDIVDYQPNKVSEAFSKLRKLSSGFWDKFSNDEEINKHLLRD